MDLIYNIFSLAAVFTEGFIAFAVPSAMCRKRYTKGKQFVLILLFSAFYTFAVTYINSISILPFVVLSFAFLCSLGVNLLLSKGSMLTRCAALMTTWFFIHALDYVLNYSYMLISEKLSDGAVSEKNHLVALAVTELIKIIAFCLPLKFYPNFIALEKKYLALIFAISLGSYITMNVFAGIIIGSSVVAMQTVAIFSILFTAVSLFATVLAVTVKTGYEKEKREAELMQMTNSMMEKNFLEMEASHNAIRHQVHDFRNHILTLSGLLEKDEAAKKYAGELLQLSYKSANYSNCGNNVIDSIINCKKAEAEKTGVDFTFRIRLYSELYLPAVDICAVLANQIDNALEACAKLGERDKKRIAVEIWQKEAFVFFKVVNTCHKNPFNGRRELISTKKDPLGLHGYGIKNITKTAESYGGTVKSDYADGEFISVAMLPNNR